MKNLKSYMIKGILFVSILGTLFHFVYAWSGGNSLVGLFAPINESIWEHTKLIFFPMLIYSFFLNKKAGIKYPCIGSAMIAGELLGILLVIISFYTYSGIMGFHTAFFDISIFYISVIIAFLTVYKLANSCSVDKYSVHLRILQVLAICLFVLFTFFPPDIPLFNIP